MAQSDGTASLKPPLFSGTRDLKNMKLTKKSDTILIRKNKEKNSRDLEEITGKEHFWCNLWEEGGSAEKVVKTRIGVEPMTFSTANQRSTVELPACIVLFAFLFINWNR